MASNPTNLPLHVAVNIVDHLRAANARLGADMHMDVVMHMDFHGFPQSPGRWHGAAPRILPRRNATYRLSALDDVRSGILAVNEAGGLPSLLGRYTQYAETRAKSVNVFNELLARRGAHTSGKIDELCHSLTNMLDEVYRDEQSVQVLLHQFGDCFHFFNRASTDITATLEPLREAVNQDENISATRAALAQLKALWDARLKVMRDNVSTAAQVCGVLRSHAYTGVALPTFEILVRPLQQLNKALQSQQGVQAQYLADLNHALLIGTHTPTSLPAEAGSTVNIDKLRAACAKFAEMRDLINGMRRLNSVQQNLDELRVELTSAE
ncbi:hypothetical protein C8Q76DRAFT_795993 [Earliella scabrosa]|nr:hypothetical protein C8Q76DRAFT_795993 [Earliella scabrosa]